MSPEVASGPRATAVGHAKWAAELVLTPPPAREKIGSEAAVPGQKEGGGVKGP